MFRLATLVTLTTALILTTTAQGGRYNQKLNIGDAAPQWHNLPGTDGQAHSLADLKEKDVVVVVFTCNSCPVAVAYEDRLLAFARKYATADSKVALVAICVNDRTEDRLPQMKERARSKGFSFPYLYDQSQQIGRDYGATITPEFFVLDRERKIVYMGAMDDKVEQPAVNYLEQAVSATLNAQKPATAETLARGCSMKYARKRK
jgi:peroxiredoxin